MKRTITSMFGALAVAAGFFLFGAPAANATVTCTDIVQTGNTNWPYHGSTGAAQICGAADAAHASGMAGQLYGLTTHAAKLYDKLSTNHVVFYIFNSTAEYDSYMTAQGKPHTAPSSMPAGTLGWTDTTAGGGVTPQWTAIFVYANGFTPPDPNGYMDNRGRTINDVTAHETGHWADYYYASLVLDSSRVTNGQMFLDLLNRDWINLNALTNCGTGGIFNGKEDLGLAGPPPQPAVYPCAGGGALHNALPLDSRYTSHNNEAILQTGWDFYFSPGNLEEFAGAEVESIEGPNDTGPQAVVPYFDGNRFSCTRELFNELIKNGVLPTKTQLNNVKKPGGASASCPTTGAGWPPLKN